MSTETTISQKKGRARQTHGEGNSGCTHTHAHTNTGAYNKQQVEAIRESGARQEVPVTVTSKIKQEANKRD